MPPKHLYCARCGLEVFWTRRALPRMGIILDLVEPHECSDEVTLPEGVNEVPAPIQRTKPTNLDTMFADFKFGKKLNDLEPAPVPAANPLNEGPGDKRPKKGEREELVTSTAPIGVLDSVKSAIPTNIGMQSTTDIDEYSRVDEEEDSDV